MEDRKLRSSHGNVKEKLVHAEKNKGYYRYCGTYHEIVRVDHGRGNVVLFVERYGLTTIPFTAKLMDSKHKERDHWEHVMT